MCLPVHAQAITAQVSDMVVYICWCGGGGGGGGWGVGAVDIRGGGVCSSESHVLCEDELECNILMFMTFFF